MGGDTSYLGLDHAEPSGSAYTFLVAGTWLPATRPVGGPGPRVTCHGPRTSALNSAPPPVSLSTSVPCILPAVIIINNRSFYRASSLCAESLPYRCFLGHQSRAMRQETILLHPWTLYAPTVAGLLAAHSRVISFPPASSHTDENQQGSSDCLGSKTSCQNHLSHPPLSSHQISPRLT